MENTNLTKKERRFLKRQQKQEEHQSRRRRRSIKKIAFIVVAVLILMGGIFGLILFQSTRPATPESEIVSRGGIHWHTELSVKILGTYQNIPPDIGIGITHLPIHTHEADGVIHLEFSGLVKEDGIRLGRFFKNWGKEFNKDCILDECNGSEGQLKMLVNGEENFEFENYVMRDKDKVEIIFEQVID